MGALRSRVVAWWGRWSADQAPGSSADRLFDDATEWLKARPGLVDGAIAAGIAACTVPQLVFWAGQPGGGLMPRLLLTILLVAPLVWRRRFPMGTFVFACAVSLVQWSLDITLAADVALLVYLGTVAAAYRLRVALLAAVVVETGVVLATLRWHFAAALGLPFLPALLLLSAPVLAALVSGVGVRARRQTLEALRDRAAQLERTHEQQAAMAVAAERARIAREMHDVVAHNVAVMVTLSDAAAVKLEREPRRAAAAMAQVSATGHQALEEMRGLLGVLRGDAGGAGLHPQPGLGQIADLVAQVRATGLDATATISDAALDVPPGIALTVHRIVQEAITNTLKHATGATRVEVRVDRSGDAVHVTVHDDGRSGSRWDGRGGHGLHGMHERASVHGGVVQAGADPAGGWTVRATIPLAPTAESPHAARRVARR